MNRLSDGIEPFSPGFDRGVEALSSFGRVNRAGEALRNNQRHRLDVSVGRIEEEWNPDLSDTQRSRTCVGPLGWECSEDTRQRGFFSFADRVISVPLLDQYAREKPVFLEFGQ